MSGRFDYLNVDADKKVGLKIHLFVDDQYTQSLNTNTSILTLVLIAAEAFGLQKVISATMSTPPFLVTVDIYETLSLVLFKYKTVNRLKCIF